MKNLILIFLVLFSSALMAQQDSASKIPFDGMDLTWINGQTRQKSYPLAFIDKDTKETILTGMAYLDSYFNYDFSSPIDNTHTISSTIGRSNEFTLNLASIGIETNYKNIIGRVWLQTGNMLNIVQDQDATVNRGRNTGKDNLKMFREGAAGYHFNKWYGINVEMGVFMSYIGLESYVTQENWCYQRSMICESTPFYFSGARVQMFPSKKLKTEIWLLNGWQSYNSWNKMIGFGSSTYYRPNENLQLVANFYLGKDDRQGSTRFHHDNSIVKRYINHPKAKGISQAAFSLNNHYGFQNGAGIKASEQYLLGCALSNRLWFNQNKMAFTFRSDVMKNPGLYAAFSPSPVTPNDFTDAIANDPKKNLVVYQQTATFDIMPNDFMTFRFEYSHRNSNVPYFSGHSGTTSPDGWITTPTAGWRPDLKTSDDRLTLAMNFRL
jgi:hypothetical protein